MNFEAYGLETIKTRFVEPLKTGELSMCVLNLENKDFEHFAEDFQLVTRSLVVTLYKDGKVIAWKNLDEIWNMVKDKDKFMAYITDETNAMLTSARSIEVAR
jgi:hypothetical protein